MEAAERVEVEAVVLGHFGPNKRQEEEAEWAEEAADL